MTAGVVSPSSVLPVHADASAVTGNDMTPWVLPTRQPTCSSKTVATGNVAGCLTMGPDEPDEEGWPSPPFPSDPNAGTGVAVVPMAGWNFNGAYNGSPALAQWETMLVSNQTAIGSVKAGRLKGMPDALPLFEGFLADVQAGGYKITDANTYSFRCTSGTTKSCVGLTKSALSNHSWGLAIDINAGSNPEEIYTGINGASACATPVKTNIPEWVVLTAEKWGLYWGGFGWDTGCTSPDQVRTSARRDATHFEFRGTQAQAQAIEAHNLGGACVDVADATGTVSTRCLGPGDVPSAGWRVVVDTKAPKGATAALVNITITGAQAAGYVTAESCGAAPAGVRTSSNGNVVPGQTVANLAVVPLDSSGKFCIYRSQAMHTIVDVEGFFAAAKSAGAAGTLFNAVGPQRVMDTRTESFCAPGGSCTELGPVAAGSEVVVNTPMVPANAVAVMANLTVTQPASPGYLTADSCTSLTDGPQTHSNANFNAGDTVANLAVVPVDDGQAGPEFCTYSTAQTQKVVDMQGYFAPPSSAGWGFTPLTPQRLVDTRGCWTDAVTGAAPCAQINPIGSVIHLRAPTGAAAVLINLTLTGATAAGFATAEPCS
ncbi:MAG TPA: M15 family metallopeptidase, partial [Ilumatobacteraceae bacterium]